MNKKRTMSLLIILLFAMGLAGCGNENGNQISADATTVSELSSTEEEETTEITTEQEVEEIKNLIEVKDDGISGEAVHDGGMNKDPIITNKSLNQKYNTGDFEVTVVSAQLATISAENDEVADYLEIEKNRDYVLFGIGVSVENTSDKDESINPNMSTIVTNTKEQVNSIFGLSDDVGGTYYGNVVKEGQIFFICPKSDINEINHIKWIIDAPISDEQSDEEALVIEFELIK